MNQLRLIKTIVFVFTFLLILGSLTLIGFFYHKTIRQDSLAPSTTNLRQSASSSIKQIVADNGLLYILVTKTNQPDKIIIFNPKKNNIVSNLTTY